MRSIFLLLILTASSTRAANLAPSITNLNAGESLTVEFTSTGCYHDLKELLVFTQGHVNLFAIDTKWSEEKKMRLETGRRNLGTLKLTKEDTEKLEFLFEFYASGFQGHCSTIDRINAKFSIDGITVMEYDFTDRSCLADDMDSVLTFNSLRRRLDKVDHVD